jgi:flagellar motor switch/type III secretory pathway protein FliN
MATMPMETVTQTAATTALANLAQPVLEREKAEDFPESHPAWEVLAGLPVQLNVSVPVRQFRVRDLLQMEQRTVIASRWMATADVPLSCDGVQLSWGEFETVSGKIGIRLTMLG